MTRSDATTRHLAEKATAKEAKQACSQAREARRSMCRGALLMLLGRSDIQGSLTFIDG